MAWRVAPSQWASEKGSPNKAALRRIVRAGPPPGVIAYDGTTPVGWCAVAPRQNYPFLARSRVLKPVDDQPVWSISCLFITKSHRRSGFSSELIKAAVKLARKHGATIVEGYPVKPGRGTIADAFAWTGLSSSFLEAGFNEVARRSSSRPIMRLTT
jgi:GNAT superfamily N-acetyltransferase